MKEKPAFMFLSENVCVPKAPIQNSFRFMQSVPCDEQVIRKELSFVRFEIVINKGSGQRRGVDGRPANGKIAIAI